MDGPLELPFSVYTRNLNESYWIKQIEQHRQQHKREGGRHWLHGLKKVHKKWCGLVLKYYKMSGTNCILNCLDTVSSTFRWFNLLSNIPLDVPKGQAKLMLL